MNQFVTLEQIDRAVEAVRARTSHSPRIGIVLGSGLNSLADSVQKADSIPFGDLPDWPRSTVHGHAGRLVIGELEGQSVMVMQGRVHLIMIGLFLRLTNLAWLGIIIFAGGALFALATLPVEFNASARAKQLLVQTGIIQTDEEQRGVNAVLNAAALTYVAGLVTAILQLLYYVSLVGRQAQVN